MINPFSWITNSRAKSDLGIPIFEALKLHVATEGAPDSDALRPVISERIENLQTRLRTRLDRPSWGPITKKRQAPKPTDTHSWWQRLPLISRFFDPQPTDEFDEEYRAGENRPLNEIIARNLEESQRYKGFRWLYLGAVVFGLAVFALAMKVDYEIMNEFWTRALANEFFEVPSRLANSIVFKSSQVVIATIAFHFLLGLMGNWARAPLIIISFLLSVAMVLGFGLLNMGQTIPVEKFAAFSQVSMFQPVDNPFVELGIDVPTTTTVAPPPPGIVSVQGMQTVNSLSWIVAPAIVFLVVTAIGALALHGAETNIKNFVKARDYKNRRAHEREWRGLKLLQQDLNGTST